MKVLLVPLAFVALVTGVAWGRRSFSARRPRVRTEAPAALAPQGQLNAALLASLDAEAEQMAAPYRIHVAVELAALDLPDGEEFGGDFPEVKALLVKAGLCVV
jgi:hypothetical protein